MTDDASDPVPLLDVQRHDEPLIDELVAAMERVARSGRFVLGPEVETFEREVAGVLGASHAVGVSSGTDALLVSLMALGIRPGDEVVTTPFSFFATAGCIARLGARPVFADIEPETFNISAESLESVLGPRTRAVLPVHLFGQPCDPAIHRIAARSGIPVVEDAAQAIGAHSQLGPAGTLGCAGCFSFFPSKNLGGFGDGGLVTTEDEQMAHRVRTLRVHGADPKYHHTLVGGNFRLDALQAAVLRVKLPYLRRWTEARRRHAERYDTWLAEAGLVPDRVIPPVRSQPGHVFNQYVVRVPRLRDHLLEYLCTRGIGCAVYYPRPLHLQPCFAELGYRPGELPRSERASEEALALPVHPRLTEGQQRRVVETMETFFGGPG